MKAINRFWLLVVWIYLLLSIYFWIVNGQRFTLDVIEGVGPVDRWKMLQVLYVDRIFTLLFSSLIIFGWWKSRTTYYAFSVVFLAWYVITTLPSVAVYYLTGSLNGSGEPFGPALYLFDAQIIVCLLLFWLLTRYALKNTDNPRQLILGLSACLLLALSMYQMKGVWHLLYIQAFNTPHALELRNQYPTIFLTADSTFITSTSLTLAALWVFYSLGWSSKYLRPLQTKASDR